MKYITVKLTEDQLRACVDGIYSAIDKAEEADKEFYAGTIAWNRRLATKLEKTLAKRQELKQ